MGIASGSVTVSQYKVLNLKKVGLSELNAILPRYKAKKIKTSGSKKTENIGWVLPRYLCEEVGVQNHNWDMSHCQVNDGFLLQMRVERKSVPTELLRLIYTNKILEIEKKKGKGLGRAERKAVREELSEELLLQALPVVSYIDAYWEMLSGRLLLFSSGKRIRELFEGLFRKTFTDPLEATLVRVDPPLLGLSAAEWAKPKKTNGSIERLAKTIPISIASNANFLS